MTKNKVETVPMSDLVIHELALSTPRYLKERFSAFKIDIATNGQLEPVKVFRNKIIDGRHRFMAMTELGEKNINIIRLPHNTTIEDIDAMISSAEMRRHSTVAQQAIYAMKQMNILKSSGVSITQQETANRYGIQLRELSRAVKLFGSNKGQYNRADIVELLFNGEKIDIGNNNSPYPTNSLQTIINWLEKASVAGKADVTGISPREELNPDEEVLINQLLNRIRTESKLVKETLGARIYFELKNAE